MNQLLLNNIAYAASGHDEVQVVFHLFGMEVASEITTMWGVMIVLGILSYLGTRNIQRIPSGLQNALEFIVCFVQDMLADMMGEKKARVYLPFLGTFFVLILFSNYSGLLPMAGSAPGLKPPTSTLSVTAAFAIIVIVSAIIFGIKSSGLSYFKHFISPVPILLPINILEQFTRPLSLSLRLYGAIYGEEMVVVSLAALVPLFLPLPMQLLGILFGAIQAFVFTLLAAIYIEEATASHH